MTSRQIITAVILLFALSIVHCRKIDLTPRNKNNTPGKAITYIIRTGNHECDQHSYIPVQYTEQKFKVLFDSSSIYKSLIPGNQYDIHKLYGFSDNDADHHNFSARFGWRWENNALRLFTYVYNNSVLSKKEIMILQIGTVYNCSIKVSKEQYFFTVNDKSVSMLRLSTTETGNGYKLFPYFGGDETAPHDIRIWIKEL